MPSVNFSDAELQALHAAYTAAAQLDWAAYDRARQRIIDEARRHADNAREFERGDRSALVRETPRAPLG